MAKKTWLTVYEDYSGVYYRKLSEGLYHFISYYDLDYELGSDNEGRPKYSVSLVEVDLHAIPRAHIDEALNSCGREYRDNQMTPEEEVAEACQSYGAHAPLWEDSSNNLSKLLREAKRQSRLVGDNKEERYERLSRPVNAIGSSALEYMQGNLVSPIVRGIRSGDKETALVGKMYGITPEAVEDLSPQAMLFQVDLDKLDSYDPLAYTAGYTHGNSGYPRGKPQGYGPCLPQGIPGWDGSSLRVSQCPGWNQVTQGDSND